MLLFKVLCGFLGFWAIALYVQTVINSNYLELQCTITSIRVQNDDAYLFVTYTYFNTSNVARIVIDNNEVGRYMINSTIPCYRVDQRIVDDTPPLDPYIACIIVYACLIVSNCVYAVIKRLYKGGQCDLIARQDIRNGRNENVPECVVCFERPQSTLLTCGHNVMCYLCTKECKNKGFGCPICRVPITEFTIGNYSQDEYLNNRSFESINLTSEVSNEV